MRDAVRNKERLERRRTPTQDPSTDLSGSPPDSTGFSPANTKSIKHVELDGNAACAVLSVLTQHTGAHAAEEPQPAASSFAC